MASSAKMWVTQQYGGAMAVGVALMCVEVSSALQLWAHEGSTSFVHYTAAMLALGPWNFLVSKAAITMTSGLIPLLIIFAAPAVVCALLAMMAYVVQRTYGGVAAGLLLGAVAVLHVLSGVQFGLLHTSWGP